MPEEWGRGMGAAVVAMTGVAAVVVMEGAGDDCGVMVGPRLVVAVVGRRQLSVVGQEAGH